MSRPIAFASEPIAKLVHGNDLAPTMRADRLIAQNIGALLHARRDKHKDLAQWCHHTETWISQILKGERAVQLYDLDRIADFFGIATYQLLQPGISHLTERRKGERRSGRDRRISHAQRAMMEVAPRIRAAHPRPAMKAIEDASSEAVATEVDELDLSGLDRHKKSGARKKNPA